MEMPNQEPRTWIPYRWTYPALENLCLCPVVQVIPSATLGTMTLRLHQYTSAGAGFRRLLEGWARAGIKDVEIASTMLDEFLKTETIAVAGRLISDLGLTPVSAACGVVGLWEPNPNRAAALDSAELMLQLRPLRNSHWTTTEPVLKTCGKLGKSPNTFS